MAETMTVLRNRMKDVAGKVNDGEYGPTQVDDPVWACIELLDEYEAGLTPRTLRFKADHVDAEGQTWYRLVDKWGHDLFGYCQKRYYCENIAKRLGLTAEFVEDDDGKDDG